MADDAPELIHADDEPPAPTRKTAGPEEKAMMYELITVAQQTFGPWRAQMMKEGASPNSDMLLASAMASFSGAIVGELVAMGLCAESSVPDVLDSHRKNAETGVEIGGGRYGCWDFVGSQTPIRARPRTTPARIHCGADRRALAGY